MAFLITHPAAEVRKIPYAAGLLVAGTPPHFKPEARVTPSRRTRGMSKLRIFIADDQAVIREGLKRLIEAEADMKVVGEAEEGEEAAARMSARRPAVVVLAVSRPETETVETVHRLRQAGPRAKIVVLTTCEDHGHCRALLEAGVSGYVLKRAMAKELIDTIREAHRGRLRIDPRLDFPFKDRPAKAAVPEAETEAAEQLSERETSVLRLISLGYSNKEIAHKMDLSVKTIETYKTRSMEKLRLRGRVDIVRHAIRQGWLLDL